MDFFYHEPRFKLPYYGRFAIRFLTYAGGAFLIAAGLVLYLSENRFLNAISLLILLTALVLLLRSGQPRRSLQKASPERPNISAHLAPEAYRKIELALDRTALDDSDFTLNLFSELLKKKKVSDEFLSKVHSRRKRLSRVQTKDETGPIISKLVIVAFAEARVDNAHSIRSVHLMRALMKIDSPEILKTFEIFGQKPGDELYS